MKKCILLFILLGLLMGCNKKEIPMYNGFPIPEGAKVIKIDSDKGKVHPVFISQAFFQLEEPMSDFTPSHPFYQTIVNEGWKDEEAIKKLGEYRHIFSKDNRLIEVSFYNDKMTLTEYNPEIFWGKN
ncbi:hypothetical protein NP92_03995 [Anoxybacillus gonensis]|uniref:Lipoprotein n=1 Tax=Anoxybacillus gonensis TaxID=198467 RepID=A0AAW7TCN0_9BACL|nr:hypothetical protein [Anoxybacillus gonensis]AKS37637.1 hypothetical protein AFK25_03565 [Anoxybacillus gonensis]KGP61561.1 hypothetical protein NP92_03995 [Anoxybacillus gonensis]MDO0876548.1 hypothetical protein [Anoxybacillus gonensis]